MNNPNCTICIHHSVCGYKDEYKKFKERSEALIREYQMRPFSKPYGLYIVCKNYENYYIK